MESKDHETKAQKALRAYYSGNIFTNVEVSGEKTPNDNSNFKSLGVKSEKDFTVAEDYKSYFVYQSSTYEWDEKFFGNSPSVNEESKIDSVNNQPPSESKQKHQNQPFPLFIIFSKKTKKSLFFNFF